MWIIEIFAEGPGGWGLQAWGARDGFFRERESGPLIPDRLEPEAPVLSTCSVHPFNQRWFRELPPSARHHPGGAGVQQ